MGTITLNGVTYPEKKKVVFPGVNGQPVVFELPEDPEPALNGASTNPPQTKAVYEAVQEIHRHLTSPYNFKGALTSGAALPAAAATNANDTYYLIEEGYRVTSNGSRWEQSSLNEGDYEDELHGAKSALYPTVTPVLASCPTYNGMITSENKWTARNDRTFLAVPVVPGASYVMTGTAGNAYVAFLEDFTGVVNNATPSFCDERGRLNIQTNTWAGKLPENCHYIYVFPTDGLSQLTIDGYDYAKPVIQSVLEISQALRKETTTDPVRAAMEIAQSYFDVAYDPSDHLVYVSEHGPFTSTVVEDDYDYGAYQEETEGHGTVRGKKAIVCSQFSQAVIAGINFANSRFVTGNESYNRPCWWGFVSDGTGNYVNDAKGAEPGSDADPEEYDPDEAHGSAWREYGKDYMSAGQQYQYFLDKGLFHPFDADHNDMKPGDLVYFWASLWNESLRDDDWVPGHRGNESGPPETIDYISHVVICVRPYQSYFFFLHSNSGRTRLADGCRAGVMMQKWTYNPTTPAGYVHLADIIKAHVPGRVLVLDERVINANRTIPDTASIRLAHYITLPDRLPRGFYTLNATVSDNVSYYLALNYVRTVDGAEETIAYTSYTGEPVAGKLSIVFYAELPVTGIGIYGRGESGTEFTVADYVLYEGYHGYDR